MNGSLRHVAVALLTAASLIVTPAFAQAQEGQNQSQSQAQPGNRTERKLASNPRASPERKLGRRRRSPRAT